MNNQLAKLIPLGLSIGIATAANAGVVNLNSLDGNTSISGEFVSYDGDAYIIRTILGEFSVEALMVECEGESCPNVSSEASQIHISGSSGIVKAVFPSLLKEFGADINGETIPSNETANSMDLLVQNELGHGITNVTLTSTNSIQGLRDIAMGKANIAIMSRPISEQEKGLFKISDLGDMGDHEQQKIFALDGLVVVTSKSNPVRAVAEKDLAQIFAGKITNWNQIGGPDAKINLYTRANDSGTGIVFNTLVMGPAKLATSPSALIASSDIDVANLVSDDPLGIGIASFSNVGNAKVLAIRGTCGIQVPATKFTIKTEEYPFSRRLYAYMTNSEKPAHLNQFMNFLDTEKAQAAIVDNGYVDLGVSYQSNDEQGLRYLSAVMPTDVEMSLAQLRDMTSSLMASDRLSITYRFALGSAILDERATDDIERLAKLLATGDFQNKELLLIGFTDSIGFGKNNVGLSLQRAAEVESALRRALPAGRIDGLPIRSVGYGEISPLVCNDTANGRRINRRVEVWLRDSVTSTR